MNSSPPSTLILYTGLNFHSALLTALNFHSTLFTAPFHPPLPLPQILCTILLQFFFQCYNPMPSAFGFINATALQLLCCLLLLNLWFWSTYLLPSSAWKIYSIHSTRSALTLSHGIPPGLSEQMSELERIQFFQVGKGVRMLL